MSYLYKCYSNVKDYAQYHGLNLVYGYVSSGEKIPEYLDEKRFISEINGKYGFVLIKLENNIYVAICKADAFNSPSMDRMMNLSSDRNELLIVVEFCDKNKIQKFMSKPDVNYIYAQSFLANPLKHNYSPHLIEKISEERLAPLMIDKKNLPKINYHDPVSAYMRLKKLDIIRITDLNPVCGKNISYRVVQ